MAEHHAAQHDAHHGSGHESHVVPLPVYYKNFAALMVLLVLTLVAAAFDMGSLNLPIALLIAVIKAVLVMLFFMHLKYTTLLVRVFAGVAFVFLLIMFVLTLADYIARPAESPPFGSHAARPAAQRVIS